MATRKRARTAGGQLAADNPATPDINEAWEDGKTKAQIDAEKAAGAEVIEEEVSEVIEAPVAAEVPSAEPLAELLADKRKDPEKQEQDPGLKPMTEERLAEIRATAVTPAAIEKSAIDEIITDAGVEKTRGREIAARLMFNARQRSGLV